MQTPNIIFDLGGVILNIDISKTKKALNELGIPQIDELFGYGHAASFFKDHEQGKISDDEFISQLRDLVPRDIERDLVQNAWNALLLEFPVGRIRFLQELGKKHRIFLFSNTNGIHQDAFTKMYRSSFDNRNLDDLFEKAYYSHQMGLRKPDIESFRYIINESNLNPSETLFIDDAEINVQGAVDAGLIGYHLKKGEDIRDIRFENLAKAMG